MKQLEKSNICYDCLGCNRLLAEEHITECRRNPRKDYFDIARKILKGEQQGIERDRHFIYNEESL